MGYEPDVTRSLRLVSTVSLTQFPQNLCSEVTNLHQGRGEVKRPIIIIAYTSLSVVVPKYDVPPVFSAAPPNYRAAIIVPTNRVGIITLGGPDDSTYKNVLAKLERMIIRKGATQAARRERDECRKYWNRICTLCDSNTNGVLVIMAPGAIALMLYCA
ncbi:hypothetical protein GQ43DRAFT_487385 [Delitschia confertaspora ATCC 74209]|uniref:Uncharacterized protein n=1 Tax=Delitschia confertaspora ATCC 74209 TaxID=1513339 RepID=A0A9P4JLR3_9PLEO|nr:hypothetical protein GQ43DRAFT_487385 [Delitschia confertaspora ATCC 74209]